MRRDLIALAALTSVVFGATSASAMPLMRLGAEGERTPPPSVPDTKQSAFAFTAPPQLDDEHAAMVHGLQVSPKTDFDRRFLQQQITVQEASLRLENEYSKGGRDQLLRKFAGETAPRIKVHLELARRIFSKIMRVASRTR
jgi:hypothetical protein